MVDIAQLGLAVDSGPVRQGTSALQDFSKAAKQAEQSAGGVTDALSKAKGPSAEFARNFAAADAQQGNYSKSANKAVDSLSNQFVRLNSTGKQWAQLSAIQKAGVDVNSEAADKIAGMAGSLYDLEQAQNRAAAANDNSTNSLEKFANTMTRRVVFAFLVAGVRQFTQYLIDLNAQIALTADTANRLNLSGQLFQGLQAAGSNKGIANSDFNSGMLAFNQQVALAKSGLGDLQTLLRSNGQAVGDTASAFGKVADLVLRAKGDYALQVSILQQAGLPATQQWVQLMEQGSEAINKIAGASSKLSDQQLEEAKKLNDQWNEMWTNFETWGKRAVVNTVNAMKELAHAGSKDKPFDAARAKELLAVEQQRLGLLGPLATVEDQVRAKQLEINAAALNNVGISKSQAAALLDITRAQAEMTRVQQQAQIGVFNLADAQKAANDNLKALVDQKLLDPNNPAQWAAATNAAAKSVENLANSAKVAGAPLEQLQRLANDAGSARTQLDQLSTTTLNSMSDNLVAIASGSVSASDGIKNFANSFVQALEKMIVQMLIIKPIADALQKSLGGLGFLGGGSAISGSSMITGGAGGMPVLTFAAADGGTFGPGWGVVGERGPELINVHSGGVTVVPNHISRPYLPGFADGGMLGMGGNVTRLPFGQNNAPVINIINQSSGQVEHGGVRQKADGSFDVVIRDMVRGVVTDDAAKNGPITKTMKAAVGGFNGS